MSLQHHKSLYAITLISALFVSSGLCAQERLPASDAFTEGTKEFLSDPARTGSLLGSILVGAAVANPLAPLLGSVAGFMIGKSSAFSNKESNAARRQAYANRSLIPDDGLQVTSLAGLTGNPVPVSEQTVITGLSGDTGTGIQSELSEPALAAALPKEVATRSPLVQPEDNIAGRISAETGITNTSKRSEQILFVELPEETGRANQSEPLEQTVALDLTGNTAIGNNLQKQLAHACSNMQLSKPMSLSCYYYSQ